MTTQEEETVCKNISNLLDNCSTQIDLLTKKVVDLSIEKEILIARINLNEKTD